MILKKYIVLLLTVLCLPLFSSDITVASFNCGQFSIHYNYIRSACLQKLTQERYNAEPEILAQLEKIEQAALAALFSPNGTAEQEGYFLDFKKITAPPDVPNSVNTIWREQSEKMMTRFEERFTGKPVVIHDQEVAETLQRHVKNLTLGQEMVLGPENHLNEWLDVARHVMATRIFKEQMKYDIIALQEADDLDPSAFPDHYEVLFSESQPSINGIAWNKEKLALEKVLDNVNERGSVVLLRELNSDRLLAVASAHLSGCNPFSVQNNDSAKGDHQLLQILEKLDSAEADLKIIAMDSNVTATHPRLGLLKKAGYLLDYKNYLYPTCTNPFWILDTRIDWIAVKANKPASISNIPVIGVGLNSLETNFSDHRPVAARVASE